MSDDLPGGAPPSQPSEAVESELAALEAMLPLPAPAETAASLPAADSGAPTDGSSGAASA